MQKSLSEIILLKSMSLKKCYTLMTLLNQMKFYKSFSKSFSHSLVRQCEICLRSSHVFITTEFSGLAATAQGTGSRKKLIGERQRALHREHAHLIPQLLPLAGMARTHTHREFSEML